MLIVSSFYLLLLRFVYFNNYLHDPLNHRIFLQLGICMLWGFCFLIYGKKLFMIARVKQSGNYLETIDKNGKRISRMHCDDQLLGNSDQIVVIQNGNYIETYDQDLKRIARMHKDIDRFLGASGDTFSIQNGNYAETYDSKCKRISRSYSK